MVIKLFGSKPRHRVVRVEVQENHGCAPPENAILAAVEQWLKSLDLPSEENVEYALKTTGWKKIGGLSGVKAFQVMDEPRNHIVELRVRISQMNDFLWRCFLVCPSADHAWDVMVCSHQQSFILLEALEKRMGERITASDDLLTPSSREERRFIIRKDLDPNTVVSRLMRGKVLLLLCHQLWTDHGQKPFSIDEVCYKAEKIHGKPITGRVAQGFMKALLVKGVVKPKVEDGNKVLQFLATPALEERALDYIEKTREAEIERLKSRKSSLLKNRAAAVRDLERLRERVRQQEENIERMENDEVEILNGITQLSSESIGNFGDD